MRSWRRLQNLRNILAQEYSVQDTWSGRKRGSQSGWSGLECCIWIPPLLRSSDPEWASYELGVFVCLNCSGIHRSLSSRVKSIKLDFWEDDLVEVWHHVMYCYDNILIIYRGVRWGAKGTKRAQNSVLHPWFLGGRSSWLCPCVIFMCVFLGPWKFMKNNGNSSAQALYEKAVPPYYYRPRENDCV